MTITQILAAIGDVVAHLVGGTVGSGSDAVTITFANSWVGQFATAITSNPILLLAFIIPMVFLGISAVRKLLNV